MASRRCRLGAGAEGVDDDVDSLAAVARIDPVLKAAVLRGANLDAVRARCLDVASSSALRPVPKTLVTPMARAMSRTPRPRVPLMPSTRTVRAGAGAGLAQCGVAGAEVAEAGALLEGDGVGQLDQVPLRRGQVLREPAVWVGVEQLLTVGAEREVAHEGVGVAVRVLAAAAGPAGPARQAGVDVDAVADLDVGDLVADGGDDTGGVEAEDAGSLGSGR